MKTRLTRQFEKVVYSWPHVARHETFAGEISYEIKHRGFANLSIGETDFLLLYKVTAEERTELTEKFGAGPDTRYKKESRFSWCIPITEESLPQLMPYVRQCYDRVIEGIMKDTQQGRYL